MDEPVEAENLALQNLLSYKHKMMCCELARQMQDVPSSQVTWFVAVETLVLWGHGSGAVGIRDSSRDIPQVQAQRFFIGVVFVGPFL